MQDEKLINCFLSFFDAKQNRSFVEKKLHPVDQLDKAKHLCVKQALFIQYRFLIKLFQSASLSSFLTDPVKKGLDPSQSSWVASLTSSRGAK